MKLRLIALALLLVVLLSGCQTSEPGVLSPGQVTASMFGQVVKVTGKVSLAVENPGGQGGMYVKLEGGGGAVGVRVQDDVWLPMSADYFLDYLDEYVFMYNMTRIEMP